MVKKKEESERFTANITMPSEKDMLVSRLDNAIARLLTVSFVKDVSKGYYKLFTYERNKKRIRLKIVNTLLNLIKTTIKLNRAFL